MSKRQRKKLLQFIIGILCLSLAAFTAAANTLYMLTRQPITEEDRYIVTILYFVIYIMIFFGSAMVEASFKKIWKSHTDPWTAIVRRYKKIRKSNRICYNK